MKKQTFAEIKKCAMGKQGNYADNFYLVFISLGEDLFLRQSTKDFLLFLSFFVFNGMCEFNSKKKIRF